MAGLPRLLTEASRARDPVASYGWWSADEVRRRQTVERKAAFIAQVSSGRAVEREVEDIGDQALSFAEVKALATGNPLILEKAAVDAEVARLVRMRRSHQEDQHRLKAKLATAQGRVAWLDRRIVGLEAALARRVDTRGDRFEMIVEGMRHRSRGDAGHHLRRVLADVFAGRRSSGDAPVGLLGGFEVRAVLDAGAEQLIVALDGIEDDVRWAPEEMLTAEPPVIVRRLERRLQALDGVLAAAAGEQRSARSEADRARSRLGAAFPFDDALRKASRRQREIDASLLGADEPARPERSHAERMAARMAPFDGAPSERRSRLPKSPRRVG